MVLGILTAVAACPAIIGTTEAVRQGQRNNAKERHRGQKANLVVSCPTKSSRSAQIDGGMVVLRKNKLYIDVSTAEELEFDKPSGHPFSGYFLPHPEHNWGWQGEGLVSTIMDDPPQLNWIYVDQETYEVKYGTKVESSSHLVGPFNCTKVDRRIIFEGWEGFLAVREQQDIWALYFDREDDGLKNKVSDKRILEIELVKKERKKIKENANNKEYI
ncbi:hypothetical protein MMC13_008379 [Lambiella insularis]|nr:hypothetical protein [Lambiella insularis]